MVKKLRVAATPSGEAPKKDKAPKANPRKRPNRKKRSETRKSRDKRAKQALVKESKPKEESEAESEVEAIELPPQRRPVAKAQEQEPEVDEEQYMDNRAFVRGLPEKADEKALRKLFGKYGVIKRVRLLMDSKGVFRGSAFVTFKDQECFQQALELDNTVYKKCTLLVQKAARPVEAPNLQVYVASLPFQTEEKVLRRDFAECGEVLKLRMLKDPQTDEFKGTAFITFADQSGVDAALKYDGTEYGGRTLVVRMAAKKGKGDDQKSAKAEGGEADNHRAKGKGKGKNSKGKGGKGKGGKSKESKDDAKRKRRSEGGEEADGEISGQAARDAEPVEEGAADKAEAKGSKKKKAKVKTQPEE